MKYLSVLGQNPELSLAELQAVYAIKNIVRLKEAAIFDCEESVDINELGGAPKIGEHLGEAKNPKEAQHIIMEELSKFSPDKKIFFGLSFYGSESRNLYNNLGKEIKKGLQNSGFKVRWAVSRELALSSVFIKTNKLLTRGLDFCLIFSGEKISVFKTVSVQDFSAYEFRDMRRPARDLYSGMTPPKLAKLLINLSLNFSFSSEGEKLTFLDPFCGSGTFLTEAALLGFKKVCGSDSSDKAVADSNENIAWLKKFYKINSEIEVKKCRAEDAQKCWAQKFQAIVTEPYLGPALRGNLNAEKAKGIQKDLNANYEKYLPGLSSVLGSGGRLVLIAPFLIADNKNFRLGLKLKENGLKAVREPILYSRPDQKVGREIYILEKI